jgi:PIN domain nuclease of toxin-antitoxin system
MLGQFSARGYCVNGVVLDTHTVIWYVCEPDNLGKAGAELIDATWSAGDFLYVSAISLVEIIYLEEKRRIPEGSVDAIVEVLTNGNGFVIIPVDGAIAQAIQEIPRVDVPDMPDRIIAATAIHLNLPLISRDRKIRSSNVNTVW